VLWKKVAATKEESQENGEIMDESQEQSKGYPPLLSVVLRLDSVSVQRLFHFHVEWLEEGGEIMNWNAMWLYSLLARCPKPIDADLAFDIRRVLRRATQQRANMKDTTNEILPVLNVLITLAAKYYGQQEPE